MASHPFKQRILSIFDSLSFSQIERNTSWEISCTIFFEGRTPSFLSLYLTLFRTKGEDEAANFSQAERSFWMHFLNSFSVIIRADSITVFVNRQLFFNISSRGGAKSRKRQRVKESKSHHSLCSLESSFAALSRVREAESQKVKKSKGQKGMVEIDPSTLRPRRIGRDDISLVVIPSERSESRNLMLKLMAHSRWSFDSGAIAFSLRMT